MTISEIIKENPGINLTVNANDLLEFGQNIANQTAQLVLSNSEDKLFTRNEVIQKFKVCSATLWRWDKIGLIQGKKIGNRRYYSESEIKELIKTKEVNNG